MKAPARCARKNKFLPILLAALLLLVATIALGQSRSSEDDVPVLRRRPSPATQDSDQNSPRDDRPQSSIGPEEAPPPPLAEPRESAQPEPQPHGASPSASEERTIPDATAKPPLSYEFLRSRSGGVMRVTVPDRNDAEGAAQISIRLRDAAAQFRRGDFKAHSFTDAQNPPGTAVMRQLREKIVYTAHGIDGGAELIISSLDPKAVVAIHQFLQFQARRHGAAMR